MVDYGRENNLAGGFNPFEKYSSNWIISPGKGKHAKYLKTPARLHSL